MLGKLWANRGADAKGAQGGSRAVYEFEPPRGIKEFCTLDGRTLLAATVIEQDPVFRSYEAYLKKIDVITSTEILTPEDFEERRLSAVSDIRLVLNKRSSWTEQQAQQFFAEAAKQNASDIHIIELKGWHAIVKFRVHGRLVVHQHLDSQSALELIRTLYQSLGKGTDSTFKEGKFQDAVIRDKSILPRGVNAIRMMSGGHSDGSMMYLRLLYDQTESISGDLETRLASLGYSHSHRAMLRHMLTRPSGIILLAGPTGSGKSTTLKHLMECMAKEKPHKNLMSVEDPVEYPIAGVLQMSASGGYSERSSEYKSSYYHDAIKASMRADPDMLMVGEIRDSSSAVAAMHSAMTGHPLLTTIHANSAWSTLHRYVALIPIEDYPEPMSIIADHTVLTGMVHQQLLATVCPHCSIPLDGNEKRVPKSLIKRIKDVCDPGGPEYQGIKLAQEGNHDCGECQGHGVVGRTVAAEVVALDMVMLQIMHERGIEEARAYWRNNYPGQTRLQHGLSKMFQGIVDPRHLEEALGDLNFDVLLEDGRLEEDELAGIVTQAARGSATPPVRAVQREVTQAVGEAVNG